MMEYNEILKNVQHHIDIFFQTGKEEKELIYHNKKHIDAVVASVIKMANHYQLNNQHFFIVVSAAWFHDIGYYLGNGAEHELNGATAAENFLKDFGVDPATILEVKQCIISTKIPQNPNTLLEQLLCDADLFHLGTDYFFEADKLLRSDCDAR